MCRGKSPTRTIVLITASTWVPFPIWYALSPEGFNIIKNTAGMRIAVAFLNVFSKGVFIFYLNRVRADLVTKQKIRANKVEQGDAWSMITESREKDLADLPGFD